MPKSKPRSSQRRRNFIAACVTIVSVGILHSSFDDLPAGEDVDVTESVPLKSFAEEMLVPLPPEVAGSVSSDKKGEQEGESNTQAGGVFDNFETLKFCTLMLKDGERFMESVDDYTVVFNKEERIDGDLQEPQSIDVKVQHAPHFAVYMKWKTGPRGQQLLYSDQYDDGNMVVKFGGIKRFLPGIKLDPNCAAAMAESRYPVTEAGILAMIRQIVAHREQDLKQKDGVHCVRLPDQEFDNRQCYVFLFTYDSPEVSSKYRKSVITIDADLHIPVMVRNFTWGTDVEGLSELELDKATLIENYSFTKLDVASDLVAVDFSRDNPRYRM